MARGLVTTPEGLTLHEDSPYEHGTTVFYIKEVPSEPAPVELETILFQDDEILAADKPHGMSVTPSGDQIARSLLNRLRESTGDDLVPLHRLDRDTAGVVLFGRKPSSRARYHALFSEGNIEREYLAVAELSEPPQTTRWIVENRLVPGKPWFRRRIESGKANARTKIEFIESRAGLGLFRLIPRTGKKHQLRIHMSSSGYPILGDPFYPEIRQPQDPDLPLQLLAYRLSFVDPFTEILREFRSMRQLRGFSTLH